MMFLKEKFLNGPIRCLGGFFRVDFWWAIAQLENIQLKLEKSYAKMENMKVKLGKSWFKLESRCFEAWTKSVLTEKAFDINQSKAFSVQAYLHVEQFQKSTEIVVQYYGLLI